MIVKSGWLSACFKEKKLVADDAYLYEVTCEILGLPTPAPTPPSSSSKKRPLAQITGGATIPEKANKKRKIEESKAEPARDSVLHDWV